MKVLILIAMLATGYYALPTKSYLREGDMLFQTTKSLATQYTSSVWPNGEVPYLIDTGSYSSNEINTIKHAMDLITSKTSQCIRFVPRTTQSNYIRIRRLSGCYSYVGNIKRGEQEVSLGNGCVYTGTTTHELMHALGFMHEQNRPDRDQYIDVNFDNIRAEYADQFEKYPQGNLYGTAYDYYSIMQYGEYAFSKQRGVLKTIIPKQSGVTLIDSYDKTDAQILTASDIAAVRARYQCTGATSATTTGTNTTPTFTTATTTTAATTTTGSGTCINQDRSCSYFASGADRYCSTSGTTYTLNGVPFTQACALLCNTCNNQATTTPSSCTDKWFCGQFASGADRYCATSGTTYYIDGEKFRQACPRLCNSCGESDVQLALPAQGAPIELNQ